MGVAQNVVPSTASVRLDVRLLQGDGDAIAAVQHVKRMAARARRDHETTLIIERDTSNPVSFQAPSNVRAAEFTSYHNVGKTCGVLACNNRVCNVADCGR